MIALALNFCFYFAFENVCLNYYVPEKELLKEITEAQYCHDMRVKYESL